MKTLRDRIEASMLTVAALAVAASTQMPAAYSRGDRAIPDRSLPTGPAVCAAGPHAGQDAAQDVVRPVRPIPQARAEFVTGSAGPSPTALAQACRPQAGRSPNLGDPGVRPTGDQTAASNAPQR